MNVYRFGYSKVGFFNRGTSELYKKNSPTNVYLLGLGLSNLRARGRLTEFQCGMA